MGNNDGLEHDTNEDLARRGKALRAPARDKAIHEPASSKAHDRRDEMKAKAGRKEKDWLSPDNPEIWDGDDDSD